MIPAIDSEGRRPAVPRQAGQATTSAVVISMVAIIVATGLVTVVCNVLGI